MRDKPLPKSESDFYNIAKELTLDRVFWERVEPATESGFPDAAVLLSDRSGQGKFQNIDAQIELKFYKTQTPNLSKLMKPSQKVGFIEYHKAGGKRKLLLACSNTGIVNIYRTEDVVLLLSFYTRGIDPVGFGRLKGFSSCDLYGGPGDFSFRDWFPSMLEMICG